MVFMILLNFLFDFYIILWSFMQAMQSSKLQRTNGCIYQTLHRRVFQATLSFFIVWFCTLSTYKFKFLGLSDLSRKIMRGISLALTGSPEEFEGGRAGDAFWVMRIIGYPVVPTADGPGPTNDIGW